MAVSLKHSFTSPKADGLDSTLVQPSNWNAEHVIEAAAGKVLGRDSSGTGVIQELPLAFDSAGQSMIPPSGTTAQRPGTPAAGMIRYNTSLTKMELYAGGVWGTLADGATISNTAPLTPRTGDLWYNSTTDVLQVYDGTAFSPNVVPDGAITTAKIATAVGLTNPTVTNYTETLFSPAAGSAFTIDLANGTVQDFTSNANLTLTLPASAVGKSFVVIVNYGGVHSLTFAGGGTLKWAGGTAPTGTAVSGKFDIFSFFCDGTNTFGQVVGQNY